MRHFCKVRLWGWPILSMRILCRTSGFLCHLHRQHHASQWYHPCIQRLQCRFRDLNHPCGSAIHTLRLPSHISIALICTAFHLSSPSTITSVSHPSFRSQNLTVPPDSDIQDNYAQPHVQTHRSQYRKNSHKFRIHTVQTRIPHLCSHC